MKKKLIGLGVSMLLLGGVVNSNATMMQTTWKARINYLEEGSLASTMFRLGERVRMSSVYDDEGVSHTRWNDGPNGVAEFGFGDDIFMFSRPLGGDVFISDSTMKFSKNLTNYFDQVLDTRDYNYRYTRTSIEGSLVSYSSFDGIYVNAGTEGYLDHIGISEIDSTGDYRHYLTLEVNSVKTREYHRPVEPVPEPATMLLFGTGLAGLAGYRKRKAMKK